MKAIILAAGIGSRMLPHTENLPKCLLKIHGHTHLDYQLKALHACGITDIIIVTGYLSEKIKEHVHVPVTYIHNPDYRTTNSAYGLWLAKDHIQDGFIHLNSDLLFHPDMLTALLKSPDEDAIIIERNVRVESDMKKAALEGNRVLRMDKKLPLSEAAAEAVGPVKFGATGARTIISMLDNLSTERRSTEWAYGIFSLFAERHPFIGVDNPGFFWAEIDNAYDYIEASQHIPPHFFEGAWRPMLDVSPRSHSSLDPLDAMDRLLNSHFKEYLSSLPNITETVRKELAERQASFIRHVASLEEKPIELSALYKALKARLLRGERKLSEEFSPYSYASLEGLATVVQRLMGLCPNDLKTIRRISEKAAYSLLSSHPPPVLLSIYGAATIEEAVQKENVLSLLSLTRVTEDAQWQATYQKLVEDLPDESFEQGSIEVVVVGEARFRTKAAQPLKPWRITHAKEAGRIICFCPEASTEITTPWLLFTLVFFHYFFETAYHGRYYSQIAKERTGLGAEIMRTIHNGKDKLTFFYSNLYSENLFWEKALDLFFRSFDIESLHYFKNTAAMGGYFPSSGKEEAVASLNLIDHIWNTNLLGPHSVTDTFVHDPLHFLYHFRGALWTDLLDTVSNTKHEPRIIENLGAGDITLTKKIIDSATNTAR